ncbi:MAG: hypothetical protein ACR2RF_11495 [Geminicoccaceae bacterium]
MSESRWDREDRRIEALRKWGAVLHYGLASCFLLVVAGLTTSVVVDNVSTVWASTSYQAGYAMGRYGREWPMCVMTYPETPKPFEPARVPL